jgi:methyl-accepting chemotaxis protein
MKISYKILFPLILVIVITFTTLSYLLSEFNAQKNLLQGFYAHNLKNQEKIVNIDTNFSASCASIPELIIANMMGEKSATIRKQADYHIHQIELCLVDLKTINQKKYSEKEKKLIQSIINALRNYMPLFKQISKICITGDSYSASEKYPELEKKGSMIQKHLKKLIAMESHLTNQAIQDTINKATQNSDTVEILIKIGGFAALFFMCLIVVLTSRYTILPIRKLVTYVQTISSGDFTSTLSISQKDEIGQLANEVIQMASQLNSIVAKVKHAGTQVAESANNLSAMSQQQDISVSSQAKATDHMVDSMEEMSANINMMASAAEEMSVNIRQLSQSADQMSHNIDSVAGSIEELSASMNDVGNSARQGADIARKSMEMATTACNTMKSLGEAADEIGEVTAVIKRIAEKTDLLAVNAAIEAASAGEAGKGFSVVAGEITKFAEQSSRAAEDISERIAKVQEKTNAAVTVISDVSTVISEINNSSEMITSAVDEQTDAANDIAKHISQANIRADEIAASTAELAIGAEDVSKNAAEAAHVTGKLKKNIVQVNKNTNETCESTGLLNHSANDLSRLSKILIDLVARFKVMSKNEENEINR